MYHSSVNKEIRKTNMKIKQICSRFEKCNCGSHAKKRCTEAWPPESVFTAWEHVPSQQTSDTSSAHCRTELEGHLLASSVPIVCPLQALTQWPLSLGSVHHLGPVIKQLKLFVRLICCMIIIINSSPYSECYCPFFPSPLPTKNSS